MYSTWVNLSNGHRLGLIKLKINLLDVRHQNMNSNPPPTFPDDYLVYYLRRALYGSQAVSEGMSEAMYKNVITEVCLHPFVQCVNT